jgi:hypothetical protein
VPWRHHRRESRRSRRTGACETSKIDRCLRRASAKTTPARQRSRKRVSAGEVFGIAAHIDGGPNRLRAIVGLNARCYATPLRIDRDREGRTAQRRAIQSHRGKSRRAAVLSIRHLLTVVGDQDTFAAIAVPFVLLKSGRELARCISLASNLCPAAARYGRLRSLLAFRARGEQFHQHGVSSAFEFFN